MHRMEKSNMEITSITASFSQKLNNGLYGGGDYEMSDHFVSLSADLEIGEDVVSAHNDLVKTCREMTQKDIEDTITSFAGGIDAERFYTYIRDLTARRPIDGETYNLCNRSQKAILQAVKRGLQMNKRDVAKDEITYEPTN